MKVDTDRMPRMMVAPFTSGIKIVCMIFGVNGMERRSFNFIFNPLLYV